MFLKWYELNLEGDKIKYHVYLISFLSNLALDPGIVKDPAGGSRRNYSIYFRYIFSVIQRAILIKPLLLTGTGKYSHKRQILYSYIGARPYSIGGFIVGRVSSREMEEASEQTSLLPHLDLRCRRLAIDRKSLGVPGRLNYWFTPIAMLSGLHRWGFSWRRIVLSTIPVYIHHDGPPSINDLELISASIVEYVYNRRMYKAYGEERYMTSEAIGVLRELDEKIKMFMETNGNSDLLRTIEFLNNLCKYVLQYIDNDISVLLDIYNELLWNNSLPKDSRYKLHILGVYGECLRFLNNVINKMISSIKRAKNKLSLLFIMVATETMSPIYLSFFIDKIERLLIEKPWIKDKIGAIRLLLLYTPQVLPQVLYSIYVLKDLGKVEEGSNRTELKIKLSEESEQSKNELPLYIDLRPLVDKQPSIVYTELKALFREYSDKDDTRILIAFTPHFTGTVSVLAALKRLGIEYKGNSQLNIKEIL